jgi:hypothetical protein
MGLDIWLVADTTCPHCKRGSSDESVYSGNYTNNVVPMRKLAGVYEALYRSDGKRAEEILPQLETGFRAWKQAPEAYEALAPANGWGNAAGALEFLTSFINACRRYPSAVVRVWA